MEDHLFTPRGLRALAQLVWQARGKHSYRDFYKLTSISHSTVRRLERAEVNPDMATLRKLAPHTGYSLDQLLAICQGKPPESHTAEYVMALIDELPPHERVKVKEYVEQSYVQLPVYDANPSAGYGSYVESVHVLEYLPFHRLWLQTQLMVNPKSLHLVYVEGESMEPTLRRGDLVLVHTKIEEIKEGIYVIWLDGAVMVKRLQRLPRKQIQVSSDHESYNDYVVDPGDESVDFRVIGQVIWTGKVL